MTVNTGSLRCRSDTKHCLWLILVYNYLLMPYLPRFQAPTHTLEKAELSMMLLATSPVVLSSVSIVQFTAKRLIKTVRYWIWITKIQEAIQNFVEGFIYTFSEFLVVLWLFIVVLLLVSSNCGRV